MKGELIPAGAKEFKDAIAGDLLPRKFHVEVTCERVFSEPIYQFQVKVILLNRRFGKALNIKLTLREAKLLRDTLLRMDLGPLTDRDQ